MKQHEKREIFRQTVLARSFYNHAVHESPHSREEIDAETKARFPLANFKSYGSDVLYFEVPDIVSRIRKLRDVFDRVAKGRPLSAVLPGNVRVDGEMDTRLGKILRATKSPSRLPFFRSKQVVLSSSEGKSEHRSVIRLFPEAFIGKAEVAKDFVGEIEIDQILLNRGGPYRVDVQDRLITVSSLNAVLSTWKVVLAIVRENRAVRHEVIARFRTGAVPTFSRGGTNYRPETSAEIGGATRGRKSTLEGYARRARRLESIAVFTEKVIESLSAKGETQAKEWLASPDRVRAHAVKRYEIAMARWESAASYLFTTWNAACFKADALPSIPATLPAVIPSAKPSAGKGPIRCFSSATDSARRAWEELNAAQANYHVVCPPPPPPPVQAVVKEPVDEAVLPASVEEFSLQYSGPAD